MTNKKKQLISYKLQVACNGAFILLGLPSKEEGERTTLFLYERKKVPTLTRRFFWSSLRLREKNVPNLTERFIQPAFRIV